MTAAVLPKFTPTLLSSALRITRNGAASPLAISGYTVAEELPRFETHTSLFLRSSATPVGFRRRVDGPWITRAGATSPFGFGGVGENQHGLADVVGDVQIAVVRVELHRRRPIQLRLVAGNHAQRLGIAAGVQRDKL